MPENTLFHVLPNGLAVLFIKDDRFPLLVQRLYVRCGAALERPEEKGVAHLVEHMVFKRLLDGQPLARVVENAGGRLNAATGYDHMVFYLDVPADAWELGLRVLDGLTGNQPFAVADLEVEKKVVLAELDRHRDQPSQVLFETLQGLVWKQTGYEQGILGNSATIENFQVNALEQFVNRYFQPQNMLLLFCGQFDSRHCLQAISEIFGKRKQGEKSIVQQGKWLLDRGFGIRQESWLSCRGKGIGQSMHRTKPGILCFPQPWNKIYLGLGFKLPGLNSPHVPGLEVLAELLGGDRSSVFYRKYRQERRMVDVLAVDSIQLAQVGMFVCTFELDAGQLRSFWPELIRELAGLSELTIAQDDLERVKLSLQDSLFQAKETLSGLASKLGYFQFFEKGLEAEHRYLYALKRVDLGELRELAARYLSLEHLQAVCFYPQDCVVERDELLCPVHSCLRSPCSFSGVRQIKKRQDFLSGPQLMELGPNCILCMQHDDSLPYLALDLTWTGGDLLLDQCKQGLAALTASALVRGTASLSATEYNKYLDNRAVYLEFYAGRDYFSLTSKFQSRFSSELFPLFLENIWQPSFAEEEVDKAKQDQVAQILSYQETALGQISRELFPFMFVDHPFALYHLGQAPGERISKQETPNKGDLGLLALGTNALTDYWYNQRLQPWVLSVCGQFSEEEAVDFAERLFKQRIVQPDQTEQGELSEANWEQEHELVLTLPDRNQAHFLVAFPLPPTLGHPLASQVTLLRRILSGQDGLLFRRLREEQGLCYIVSPLFWRTRFFSLLGIYIGTFAQQFEKAVQGVQDVLTDLGNGLLDREALSRAKKLVEVDFYRNQQPLLKRSSEASELLLAGQPLDYQHKLLHALKLLDAEALQSLVRDHLVWERGYRIAVLP